MENLFSLYSKSSSNACVPRLLFKTQAGTTQHDPGGVGSFFAGSCLTNLTNSMVNYLGGITSPPRPDSSAFNRPQTNGRTYYVNSTYLRCRNYFHKVDILVFSLGAWGIIQWSFSGSHEFCPLRVSV